MISRLALLAFLCGASASALSADDANPPQRRVSGVSSARAEQIVGQRSRAAMRALQSNDTRALATLVHPTRGVSFSPYVYADAKTDINFKRGQIAHLAHHPRPWNWGDYDGEGGAMMLTWNEFRQRALLRRPYLPGAQQSFNEIYHNGNVINNVDEAYPGAIIARYYRAGTEKYGGMDWQALYLAWRPVGKTWYLVGIVGDQWST